METSVSLASMTALIQGRHDNPRGILGPHEVERAGRKLLAVRTWQPEASQVWLVDSATGKPQPMRRIHPAGFFEIFCPAEPVLAEKYQLRVAAKDGELFTMHDPYAFPSIFEQLDFHLFGEGTHELLYQLLGAQCRTIDGVAGTNFSVWAPNAETVSVVGDFNNWDDRVHRMQKRIPSGIWELFLPNIGPGEKYKFKLKGGDGNYHEKSDPFGFAAELPPRTASVVTDLNVYEWRDQDWLARRANSDTLRQPFSVYEVHLGSWRRRHDRQHGWMNYRELAHQLVQYCHETGFTHIELMPVSEHPYTGSWGYQTVGYFAVTSRYGSPEDFMYFVDYCHQHDIGVIIDWVPAHFPKDAHGLRQFDGTALYEHADPRQGEHPDWGTLIFNYGRNEVRNFLVANALFWLDKYHIDGLRVDAVASMIYLDYSREEGQWVPNQFGGRENLEALSFMKDTNTRTHGKFPGTLMIAEESTSWGGVSRPVDLGGLGFSMKWNMGWMNDTLSYMQNEPIHRRYHHNELTFSLIYAFTENFCLPLSHDEVVHGKGSMANQMPGDLWQKFANLRLLYSYMWTHPGKQLLFMGSEFGQWDEWNHDAELQWDLVQWETHGGLRNLVSDLNKLMRREPALYEQDFEEGGFEWIDCHSSDDSVLAYIRRARDPSDFVLVCCNFTPVVRKNHRVGAPEGGFYREILNSDSEFYGGTNVGNVAGTHAQPPGHHGRPYALTITLPPLAVLVFKPQR